MLLVYPSIVEYHILSRDNFVVVSNFVDIDFVDYDRSEMEFPHSHEDDILGDIVIFRIPEDNELGPWYCGRLTAVDPEADDLFLINPDTYKYHQFPTTNYLYFQVEESLSYLHSVLDRIDIETLNFSIVYPPILMFPEQFPTTLKEGVKIDIWLATDSQVEDSERFVDVAKVHRSYSYNYVKSMLDFSNLPDYKS